MFKLEWKVNGRTMPPNRVADELGKSIKQAASDKVKHAIAAVRCPVHGGDVSNIRVENTGSKMNFTFNACCDGLKQAIAAHPRSEIRIMSKKRYSGGTARRPLGGPLRGRGPRFLASRP